VIERLLAAERALAGEDLDQAERLYGQVAEADDRNAIAVAGLARVAQRRGDGGTARQLAERALAIDPDEAAAARLLLELEPAVAGLEPLPTAAPAAPTARGLPGWLRRLFRRSS